MSELQEQVDRHEGQITAIRNLVHEGMRLMVETRKDLRSLAAAQKRTEQSLQQLLNGLRRGGNGHAGRKIDTQ